MSSSPNVAREKANASTKSLLVQDNWAPEPKEYGKSMSLGTVQRAGTAKTRQQQQRPDTSYHQQKPPCTLSTEGIDLKQVNPVLQAIEKGVHPERPAVSMVNFNRDVLESKAKVAAQRQVEIKARGVDAEAAGFLKGTNSTTGIEGAQPRTSAGGSSTFHTPIGTAKLSEHYNPEAVKRNPLNPTYSLACRTVAPEISKTDPNQAESSAQRFERLTGKSQSAAGARKPKHPWDITTEHERVDRMDTKAINGPKRQVTRLKPKPADKASAYFDYSDIDRSTNRWYCDLQERRAKGKPQYTLSTSDVNQKRLSWNERYNKEEGKIVERKTDPLTPRYTHDGEPYGEFEKGVRTGMRLWKSGRTKSHIESTLDIEGAQPCEHGMPRSLQSHKAKAGEVPGPTLKDAGSGMAENQRRRHQTNDVFGADRMNAEQVALRGTAAAYGLPFKTEQQLNYNHNNSTSGMGGKINRRAGSAAPSKSSQVRAATGAASLSASLNGRPASAQAAEKDLSDQWNIIHLSSKHVKATSGLGSHASCSFSTEVNGGRQTNPVMPMYDYSRPATHNQSNIPEAQAWDPTYDKLNSATKGGIFRTCEDKKVREQTEKSMRDFHNHLNKVSKASKVDQLKGEIKLVRSLPTDGTDDQT